MDCKFNSNIAKDNNITSALSNLLLLTVMFYLFTIDQIDPIQLIQFLRDEMRLETGEMQACNIHPPALAPYFLQGCKSKLESQKIFQNFQLLAKYKTWLPVTSIENQL